MRRFCIAVALLLQTQAAVAAGEECEVLSHSVRTAMRGSVSERAPDETFFDSAQEGRQWLAVMGARLKKILPQQSVLQDRKARESFLLSAHYEASRAGLDPQLVLAVIHVESAFRKYAISVAGARGYMQIMPFWTECIGEKNHNLFRLRANLRYGAVILRHYLDLEKGNLFRALGRYNGSLGRARYPNAVFAKLEKHWRWR